jgi:hypothetical protein
MRTERRATRRKERRRQARDVEIWRMQERRRRNERKGRRFSIREEIIKVVVRNIANGL